MEKISDLFGGQNSTTKVMKVLLQGSVDNIPPIGDMIPWISDDDIPDGYNHLGAQSQSEADPAIRNYSYSEFPEFCDFLNRQQGKPTGHDAVLSVMANGDTTRQAVKFIQVGDAHRDKTTPWTFQGDAIRPVKGGFGSNMNGAAWFPITGVSGAFDSGTPVSNTMVPNGGTFTLIQNDSILSFDISREHPVAKDVRMANRSVNWLIKVKHTKGQQDMIDTLNTL